ncbi:hypothetical protein M3Y97_00965500 [Aphelenchoides bicaudatus]|nr:hypothetical protein M3Y97_00965500 [Aphelenchoides bicaudatus]
MEVKSALFWRRQGASASWLILLICILCVQTCFCYPSTYSVLRTERFLDMAKRGLDLCGCNMGCFYESTVQCASCCAMGI